MLPEPSLTFTLPSLHDGLALDCRVYHPQSLTASPQAPPWQKHAAIVAHPYAPLGGCYDDPVVEIVAGTLLRLGFLVATFNFRGAHGSAGRTSWTAKAETADYISVAGFVSHYVHFLDPFHPRHLREPISPRVESLTETTVPTPNSPILLLAGYSYGAMVTTKLPPLETVLAPFDTPACGSPAAEIRLRAQHLAEAQNAVLASARAAAVDRQKGRSVRKSLGLRIGGDEENRKSHDSRRSISSDIEDRLHKGVAELMTKARKGHRKRPISEESVEDQPEAGDARQPSPPPEHLLPVPNRTSHRPAYLLVSPLQGVVTNLATMSFPSPIASLSRRLPTRSFSWSGRAGSEPAGKDSDSHKELPTSDAERKLTSNPTLAIYGDNDSFVAARKLREWASRLERVPDSKFRAHEVSSAGHFWAQGNAAVTMKDAVKVFAESVLRDYQI
ncbi:Alpha/Beta hydrolase protein [Podospora aff. communis PSN243]|uniref:Alpha/Beta hydrolase protein n=1 Tax=Podospora aff. communis PSN243 TaxID=3040156 RepID=A0AAV9GBR5_9PEZI|nr:Alpha/Beta hydrolase protein [Podospora aff. communis PSN243]